MDKLPDHVILTNIVPLLGHDDLHQLSKLRLFAELSQRHHVERFLGHTVLKNRDLVYDLLQSDPFLSHVAVPDCEVFRAIHGSMLAADHCPERVTRLNPFTGEYVERDEFRAKGLVEDAFRWKLIAERLRKIEGSFRYEDEMLNRSRRTGMNKIIDEALTLSENALQDLRTYHEH